MINTVLLKEEAAYTETFGEQLIKLFTALKFTPQELLRS